jgi:HlyD family secretion protein
VGRRVMPNETLIILPDTSEMIAQVRVHESLAGRVRKGQAATVKVEAAGGMLFSGRVDSVGILAEGGGWRDPNRREYTVKIDLQNDQGTPLKPSMRCEATVVLGRVDDSVAVPVQAVFTEDPVKFVYVPRNGKYARVPVQIGQRSDTLAQVVAGVGAGERVLIRQPSPAETLRQAWDEAQLKLVGLKLTEDGKVEPLEAKRPGPAMAGGPRPDAPPMAGAEGARAGPPAGERPAHESAERGRGRPEKAGEAPAGETKVAEGQGAAAPEKGDAKPEATAPAASPSTR